METPLKKVLKTFSRAKKQVTEIRVCDCGVPMIFTFAFAYCERFCLNCGNKGGMFGTGDDVPLTIELKFQKKLVDAIWAQIYGKKGGLLPNGTFGRNGCKKDDREGRYASSCNDHRAHLTKLEIEKDKLAREYLERFKGVFTTPIP